MSKWIGEIGDVRIYNRALPAKEIAFLRWLPLFYMPWYGRLYFWLKEAWLTLIGKRIPI